MRIRSKAGLARCALARRIPALFLLASCAAEPPPTTATAPPHTAPAPAAEDDTAVDNSWLEGTPPEGEEVSQDEAQRFATAVFDAVERHIYDPALVAAHGAKVRADARAALAGSASWVRKAVLVAINDALKAYGVSHLGVATPSKVRVMLGVDAPPGAPPKEAVYAEQRDGVGIVRIESFLVPQIRHASVAKAFEVVRDAKALLIDLRGNHGGSASSVVYAAQYVVGPKVLTQTVRTRGGVDRSTPHAMRGFFPDDKNEGSNADIKLEKREGHVAWWTPDDAPATPRRPTFVLVDGECGSSCEIFAAALADAGAARILGQRTAGVVLGSEGVKGPWKGYLMIVPFATVLSPKGRTIEAKGVEPDVVLDACARPGGDARACLDAAMAQVKASVLP